jgi:hypothetical protein
MKRPAQPAELAPAYVFLASSESSYVNGEVLGISSGVPLGKSDLPQPEPLRSTSPKRASYEPIEVSMIR